MIRAQEVVSVDPTENNVSAQADTDIVAELDAAPSTPDITNFVAYGQHHGVIAGSYSSDAYSITLDPLSDFLAGELVTTTVTSGMLSNGVPVEPFVWQFRAAAATAAGAFVDSGQTLGPLTSYNHATGDVDEDGDVDAILLNYYAGILVFLNDGSGTLSDSGQLLGVTAPHCAGLADVDGDGDLDAVVGNDATPNKLWLNDGSGMFSDSGQTFHSASCYGVGIVDLNGDGALDVLSVSSGGPSYVWLNEALLVFEDGFESGDTSEWSLSSDSG